MKDMDVKDVNSVRLVEKAYYELRNPVYLYIYYKVGNREDAEDLVHDVFTRLLECRKMLRPDTVKPFIMTVARNLVYDYLRHLYKKTEVWTEMCRLESGISNVTEEQIAAHDLSLCERHIVARLPEQRRKIYQMTRYAGKTVSEISQQLHLSCRTVENHLSLGRKDVRAYIRQCI